MLTTRMRKNLGTRFYVLKQIYNIINEYSRTEVHKLIFSNFLHASRSKIVFLIKFNELLTALACNSMLQWMMRK